MLDSPLNLSGNISPEASGKREMLRQKIRQMERGYVGTAKPWVLSTGFAEIDQYLGLRSHSVHEVTGEQAYGYVIRLLGQLDMGCCSLWCRMASSPHMVYGHALKSYGVEPERIIFVQCHSQKDLLWAMEEGLRSGAVSVVIGEPNGPLNLTSSRRLQLAAETGGSLGLILNEQARTNLPHNALFSRWRVTATPIELSERFAWNVELLRMRGVKPRHWRVSEAGFHD